MRVVKLVKIVSRWKTLTAIAAISAITIFLSINLLAKAVTTDLPLITDFTSVTDSGCGGCSVTWNGTTSTLTTQIAGAADNVDTAYGLKDFGGTAGWSGRTYTRSQLGFPAGQAAINQNLAVFEEYSTTGSQIYELYVNGSTKMLSLWSTTGGLRSTSINSSTGVVVPTGSTIRVEVSALANNSVVVRVNDVDKITLTGLAGATTTNARYLRAGIDHYDGSTAGTVRFNHTNVGITTLGWLGTRTAPLNSPPVNTSVPTISGTTSVGQTLTASNGIWSGSTPITYTYQWQRCDVNGANCANISGATAQTYTLGSSDVGSKIIVSVTATNAAGSSSASSAVTAVISGIAPSNTTMPIISGNPQVGQTLSVSNGTWSGTAPITYTYQWQRCDVNGANCANISGATAASYLLGGIDQGSTLRAVVTGTNSYGSAGASSAQTGVVAVPPANTVLPLISGTPTDGQVLTTTTGTWSGTTPITYTYQWQRCDSGGNNCSNISGATSQIYPLNSSDVSSTIKAVITASNSAGSASAASAATVQILGIAPNNTTLPSISGSPKVGQTLSASAGTWSGTAPITYSYQWQRCDNSGINCTAIPDASSSTYSPTTADQDSTINVAVTAVNTYGNATAVSAVTGAVVAPPANTGAPVISGITQDKQVLSSTNGTWSGSLPQTFAYQWQRCDNSGANCANISGATAQTYTLSGADVGSTIKLSVTATNSAGSSSASSAVTAVISGIAPSNTAAPVISGSPQVGQTLSVTTGTWSGTAPITYTYQWQRCDSGGANCVPIGSAVNQTYQLVKADQASTIEAVITATNSAGTGSAASLPTAQVTAIVPALPASIAALGDSLSRAYGASGTAADSPAQSWTTGTDTQVYSHYLRILARSGLIANHAYNDAVSGSAMSDTSAQAATAIGQAAQYITLMSGTNDVCTPTVAGMTSVANFSTQFQTTLNNIKTSLPNTQILVASIPNWYGLWQTYQSDPAAQTAWSFYNRCPDLLGMSATDNDRQAVSQRTIDLNNATSQVCATFANCTYDGGAAYQLSFGPGDLAFDFFHPTSSGQASISSALWGAGPYAADTHPANPNPPANTAVPLISGSAIVNQTLSTSSGSWNSTAPVTYTYGWQRCDSTGASCSPIAGATNSSYLLAAGDAGSTLRSIVVATSAFGSSSSQSAATSVVTSTPPVTTDLPLITDFTSVTDSGCSGCSVAWNGSTNTLTSTIAGGVDTKDTAYGLKDFGGSSGWSGMTYSRTILGFPAGQAAITQNLSVFQEYDINGSLIYELYVNGSDKTLSLWSPAGGLRTSSINTGSGVVVPTSSTIRVEVAALANNSITVRVNDTAKITLTGLSGATSKNPRYLRAGIDHYDATTTNEVVKMAHTNVGITTLGWLGIRTAPFSSPPVNTVAPSITGPSQAGGLLSANPGTWSGAMPITYSYQWQRCDSAGANCIPIANATSTTYTLTPADQGSTVNAVVTASNAYGTATAASATTSVVVAANLSDPSYSFTRNIIDPTGGQCASCGTQEIEAGDIDGDGHPDLVVSGTSQLLWYHNPAGSGSQTWTTSSVATGNYGAGAMIIVRDMNHDGRMDIIVGQSDSSGRREVWFENTTSGWVSHLLSNEFCHDLTFGDIDGDGITDAVCNNQFSNQVVWLKAPADPTALWSSNIIDPSRWVMGNKLVDMNGDGRLDVVAGRAWYKNSGNFASAWARYPYTTMTNASYPGFNDAEKISVLDLNGDGHPDIVATVFAESPQGQVWAFLSPADPTGTWTGVQLDSGPLFAVHSQADANFDGTGRPQIMVGESNFGGWDFGLNTDPQIYIYRLKGPANVASSWERTTIDATGTHEAGVADFDGDGKIDIFGQQENTDLMTPPQPGAVQVWLNRTVY